MPQNWNSNITIQVRAGLISDTFAIYALITSGLNHILNFSSIQYMWVALFWLIAINEQTELNRNTNV